MVHIDFYLDGFEINGHANFAQKGNDIVCAAISGICFGSINWFNKNDIIIFENNEKKAKLIFKVNLTEKNKLGISLIETQIKTICDSYNEFCKFKKYNKELE